MSLRTSIFINLAGNLEERARRYSQSIRGLAATTRQHIGGMGLRAGREMMSVGSSLRRRGNQLGGVSLTAGLALSGKHVIDLERRFTRLGIGAEQTKGQMEALKAEIYATSQMPDIEIDPSQLTSAIEVIASKTGDINIAKANIKSLALMIQATGAAGEDAGSLVANLSQQLQIKDAQGMLELLDTLALQGKSGAFELRDFATQGERVATAYAATGRVGKGAALEMGAMLQIIRSGVSGAEQASTAMERVIDTFTGTNASKFEAAGLRIWDPEILKTTGQKVARSIPEIIKDLVRKTGGDQEKIASLIPESMARKAIAPFANEYRATGEFRQYEKILALQGKGKTLTQDAARAAQDAASSIQALSTAWQEYSDKFLKTPIDTTADFTSWLLKGGIGDATYDFSHTSDKREVWKKKSFENEIARIRAGGASQREFKQTLNNNLNSVQKVEGSIKLEVVGTKVRVQSMQSKGVDLDVYNGPMSAGQS